MNAHLFLVDDNKAGFWDREEKDIWTYHLGMCDMQVEKFTNVSSESDVIAKIQKIREHEHVLDCFLITDQQLFGGQFNGSDLSEKLVKDNVVKRAVIFSEIARLRSGQRTPPLMAESRVKSHAAIKSVFEFLKTGQYPRTDDLLECGARIQKVLGFFADSVAKCDPRILKDQLFRPARAYCQWEGNPQDVKFLFDCWLVGLGTEVADLFSHASWIFFGKNVERDVLHYLGGENNERAINMWERVGGSLHPWKSLELASQQDSNLIDKRGGSFRLLMEISKCGGQADLIPIILYEEMNFSPRERAWIIKRRKRLRIRIKALLKGGDSELQFYVQQCVNELKDVSDILSRAAEIRDQR